MRLSIIIPMLDEAAGITAALAPLQALRRAGHELIVVDGGSADGSAALAAPLADRVVHSAPGRARQMNTGARLAGGEVLVFLHADSALPNDCARLIAEGLPRSGRRWGRFDVRLSGRHPALRLIETLMNLRSRLSGIATGDQAIFVERRLFESVGGFPDIALMEDIALSRVLKRSGRPLCLSERVITSSRRWENHGIASTVWLMWRLRLAYFFGADPRALRRRYGSGGKKS